MQDSGSDRTNVRWAELGQRLDAISEVYAERYGIDRTPAWHAMKICEESGELMQWFLASIGQGRARGKTPEQLQNSVDDEIADVICHAVLMAHHRGTDLGAVITRKWLRAVESAEGSRGGPG
ncbi:pyrophosphatase [Nocardia altamirensis]|uniref:pyrophosphatase n=1 Tax=Nocardia altamirensis TaxID=472158 RepID=UPI001FE17222|nr:pyrophosphatase [Nocardia altamirensis]